jgi:glycosyltransferase involved in cell wall biosynthesis
MTSAPTRVLLLCTHPVQYSAPVFRSWARDPRLDIQVAYCSLQGAEKQLDPGFGREIQWDVPLLEGYPWVRLPNRSPRPRVSGFFGLINPGVWALIRNGRFDAVTLFTGYVCTTFWIAIAAAKSRRIPVLFGTDAHNLDPRDGRRWKSWIKKLLWPRLFSLADVVIVPSTSAAALMRSLGIRDDRLVVAPYTVNNAWWLEQAAAADRAAVRARWNIPIDAGVILFCAKLQPWKRPADLLAAFARVAKPNLFLVFAGDGPLLEALESQAQALGLAGQVRFLGFVNQSGLPETYVASDIFVLPSDYEPFGVVVNESMLCGRPAIVSDRVGAGYDLVREGETGYVFPCGQVDALAAILRAAFADPARLGRMGEAARRRMSEWSPAVNQEAFVRALAMATGIYKEIPATPYPAEPVEIEPQRGGSHP